MVKHLEILSAIWNAFFEMGSETRKKILLSEELDEATREKMKAIIEKRGGEIVTKEDEASHIVYGAPPKSANSDGTWFIGREAHCIGTVTMNIFSVIFVWDNFAYLHFFTQKYHLTAVPAAPYQWRLKVGTMPTKATTLTPAGERSSTVVIWSDWSLETVG